MSDFNFSSPWLNRLKGNPIPWLLDSNPWTRYRTLVDLMGISPEDSEAKKVHSEIIRHPQVQSLLNDAGNWFPQSITRHNDPKICYYKLRMLADFGLTQSDPGIRELIPKVTGHLADGMYATRETLPQKGLGMIFPDSRADEWHALPCDTPIIIFSLRQLGVKENNMDHAIEIIRSKWDNPSGWFCHFFFMEGQYQKLQIGCPMAGLMALEVFSLIPELKESFYARNAFETLKFHKEYGQSVYFFGRSKKFWTLKYPFIWYNALYLADVLTRFNFTRNEPLVAELIQWIEDSQNEDGRWKANSRFAEYKTWDFSDKKASSPWISLLCCRTLKRWYEGINDSL